MEKLRSRSLVVAGGLLVALGLHAQTQGTCTFTVTTLRDTGAEYDPRHVLAIWVTNASGTFVKTLKKRAASRESHLDTWVANSGKNVVDAITGATLSAHETHTVTWNCRNVAGQIVPDGEYRIRVEFTSENAQGPITPAAYIKFTKGPAAFNSTYPNVTNFTNMSVAYAPDLETFTVVAKKSSWRYSDAGRDLHATDWKTLSYDDSDPAVWKTGSGKFGYGDTQDTALSYGPSAANVYPCYYFRHEFTSDNVPLSLKLNLLRDDGAIVYLNGTEVVRSNMPAGAVAYTTLATASVGSSDETTFFQSAIDPALVVVGENILAVELHQQSVSSSDLGFDLELMSQPGAVVQTAFTRGDANADGTLDIGDAITILGYLFSHGGPLACRASADANDDGKLDLSDAVKILLRLFAAGGPLPDPFGACDVDPTPDSLGCTSFAPCR